MKNLLAFCSACHPRLFDIPHDHVWKKIDPLGTPPPPAHLNPTPGAWPRRLNKNPVWYVLYLSFVRTHTKFGKKKTFEIEFVIEVKWYLTFWPLLRAQGGGAKTSLTLHAPFMSVTHTSNQTDERTDRQTDGRTDRQTDGGDYNIPYGFLNIFYWAAQMWKSVFLIR